MLASFFRYGLAASLLAASFSAFSAVQVVESKSVDQQQREAEQEQQNAALMSLFNQIQLMQEELMQLRGMVEEQEHQLQQLKQQQYDDYLQLDTRIAELSGGAVIRADDESGDQEAYQQAYQLIQERKFKEAIVAFESFCKKFPASNRQANALYWLGELYIVDGQTDKARESFGVILSEHKDDRKYLEAVYKIATLDIQQGRKDKALQAVDSVLKQIKDDPSYAALNEKVLAFKSKHFP